MDIAIWANGLTRDFKTKHKAPGLRGSLRSLIRPAYTPVHAVRNLNLTVHPGERVAFIGPNGAGKSTTIKMLTGILYPTAGQAQVLGFVPWRQRQQLAYHIGALFGQKSQLWYDLPAQDSFDLLAQIYKLPPDEYRRRLNHLVELFEIGPFLQTPVRKLSLGQRMRGEIAAALLHHPQLLLLDEPTIGLDVVAKQHLRDLILHWSRSEGVTILLASHDAGDVEVLCDRAIVINEGRLIYDGTLDQLKECYVRTRQIALKLAGPFSDPQLRGVRVLSQDGYSVSLEVHLAENTVERAVSSLLAQNSITDILVSIPSMEQIIRDIYQNPVHT